MLTLTTLGTSHELWKVVTLVLLSKGRRWWYLLMVGRKRNLNEIRLEKKEHIKASIRCVVSLFVFCQANIILVPFPAHRQQVLSIIISVQTQTTNVLYFFWKRFNELWINYFSLSSNRRFISNLDFFTYVSSLSWI